MEHEKAMKIAAEKCAALLPVEALDKGGVGP